MKKCPICDNENAEREYYENDKFQYIKFMCPTCGSYFTTKNFEDKDTDIFHNVSENREIISKYIRFQNKNNKNIFINNDTLSEIIYQAKKCFNKKF